MENSLPDNVIINFNDFFMVAVSYSMLLKKLKKERKEEKRWLKTTIDSIPSLKRKGENIYN